MDQLPDPRQCNRDIEPIATLWIDERYRDGFRREPLWEPHRSDPPANDRKSEAG
jgi:hypothetical protein